MSKFNYMEFSTEDWKNTIPINIWDDYYDDGHVPEGYTQNTHIYVEDSDIPEEDKEKILKILLDYIKDNIYLPKTKFKLEDKLYVKNLTHSQREITLQVGLSQGQKDGSLSYKGKLFRIYSES